MADPTLDHVDSALEAWDAVLNDDLDKISANFMRRTKGADHGQETYFEHQEAELTLAGPTTTATTLIPAGCVLQGVSLLVTETVTGGTDFDAGDGVTQDLYAAAVGLAFGVSTDLIAHKSTWTPTFYKAAGDVVLTSNGGDFTGGKVRVTVHYLKIKAATS